MPSFSRDGTKLAFISRRTGTQQVWIMDANGANPVQVTNHPAGARDPSFSPDGTKILFGSERVVSNYEIYQIDVDGANEVQLTNTAGDEFFATYNAAGTHIYFTYNVGGNNRIYVMNPDGSFRVALTSGLCDDSRATP
jgi:Tol biopolymer transport system component